MLYLVGDELRFDRLNENLVGLVFTSRRRRNRALLQTVSRTHSCPRAASRQGPCPRSGLPSWQYSARYRRPPCGRVRGRQDQRLVQLRGPAPRQVQEQSGADLCPGTGRRGAHFGHLSRTLRTLLSVVVHATPAPDGSRKYSGKFFSLKRSVTLGSVRFAWPINFADLRRFVLERTDARPHPYSRCVPRTRRHLCATDEFDGPRSDLCDLEGRTAAGCTRQFSRYLTERRISLNSLLRSVSGEALRDRSTADK
jgi:hypothetical protein